MYTEIIKLENGRVDRGSVRAGKQIMWFRNNCFKMMIIEISKYCKYFLLHCPSSYYTT